MKLDWCRLMRKIHKRPEDLVPITYAQLLEFTQHRKKCAECTRLADEVMAKSPPRIGLKPEVN